MQNLDCFHNLWKNCGSPQANRLVFQHGEKPNEEAPAQSEKDKDRDMPKSPRDLQDVAKNRGAQMIGAGQEKAEELSDKEKQAKEYCKSVEASIKTNLARLMTAEDGPQGPDPSDKDFDKKNEEHNKKYKAKQDELAKVMQTMCTGMKSASENKKVVDRTMKEQGAMNDQGKATSVTLMPSDMGKKIYVNYKINNESDGGWAVKEDLSDVPGYVESGDIDLGKFKTRTNAIDNAVKTAATSAEAAKKKYG